MRDQTTEIVILLDASGSMGSIRDDAVGGFNTFVQDQKKEEGAANITVIFFDSNRYDKWVDGISLRACPKLGNEYRPGAATPLLDATGRTIEELGARLNAMPEVDRPGRVMVIVITDGYENSSQIFSKEQIKEKIRHQEQVYKWEFVFLAANVDAFDEGAGMGFRDTNVASYTSSKKGVRAMMRAVSASAAKYRRHGVVEDLCREIPEDE